MIHEDNLYDITCPSCGSDDIETLEWSDSSAFREWARISCDCGFSIVDSCTFREIHQYKEFKVDPDDPEFTIPYEYVHNGKDGEEFESEIRFSPRLLLEDGERKKGTK